MKYQERRLTAFPGGFGEWNMDPEGSELYDDLSELIAAAADNGCALVELGTPEAEALGAEDIRGRIHNERGVVYAFAYGDNPTDIGYTAIIEVA